MIVSRHLMYGRVDSGLGMCVMVFDIFDGGSVGDSLIAFGVCRVQISETA